VTRDSELGAAAAAFTSPFDGVIRIEAEGLRPIWIDGRASPPAIGFAAPEAATGVCVWRGARETIMRILEEERALGPAFISGRLAIAGDMSVMARLRLSKAPRG
jgi:hypothetical protein